MFVNTLSNFLKISRTHLIRNMHNSIKEHKVKVGNVDINIVEAGSGNNSVLLMPGALGSAWTDFKPQIENLPKLLPNYTIIAWDPPGYGKSIPPKRNFGLAFFQDDAKCAVDLMKSINRPKFSILGWSDGGITALIMAGRYTENIEKLAIWGAGAYLNKEEVKALQNIRDVNKWSPRMREPMEQVYGAERFAELWGEWTDAAIDFYTHCDGNFCRSEVTKIKSPTFILHGKKDPMIAAEHIPYLRQRLPFAKYHEFPDGKHNIHLRYPDEFNKLVSDFFLTKL
ncbi:valacyclovir hydrolase-like [Teleopsis dalmanni]|uniref:valacyclovir hydrolase-like n=1 Tax=Teleopsis dalmanni TaxID=139649 RepID=UPI000D32C419|nr:valacyclovir hydrolase-like [Teleopsis dalmanni]